MWGKSKLAHWNKHCISRLLLFRLGSTEVQDISDPLECSHFLIANNFVPFWFNTSLRFQTPHLSFFFEFKLMFQKVDKWLLSIPIQIVK